MLTELRAKDYAIIDDLAVRFVPGLTVLTGETGAGKSIIVGALSFALGERVSEDVIRKGRDLCRVEACFHLGSSARTRPAIPEDLVGPEETAIAVSREIGRDSRSRCAVNGRAVSLTSLREIGKRLVDFHGQHEHQVILDVASHIDFLDDFGDLRPLRNQVAESRRAFIDVNKKIGLLGQRIEDVTSKRDFIKFEIGEIEGLNLKESEDANIEDEIGLLENAEKILQAGGEASGALYDGDEAALKTIARARQLLEKLSAYSRSFSALGENLDQAQAIVKEVAESLRDSLGRIDLDASRLEYLRERSRAIDRIKRKYGKSVAEVLAHLKELKASLENREELEAEIARLEAERDSTAPRLLALARRLSELRKATAARFEKLIEAELKSLGMEGGAFKVVFETLEDGEPVSAGKGESVAVSETGTDGVEFFLRTNKGEDLMPLRRIASGGEVSRVMLALKRVLADVDRVGTLVFDEIDSGIGGTIADVVASKLRQVSASRQVICITHLAQIAAAADLHLAVDKDEIKGRTVTRIDQVSGEGQVKEIVRMLAGAKAPKAAWVHAQEMLKRKASR